MSVDEEKVQALITRIDLSRRSRNFKAMRELSLELITTSPENSDGHQLAGQAEICLENFPAAEKHLRQALALSPQEGFSHFLLAALYRQTGKTAQSEEHIQKALSFEPVNPAYWCELAHLCHTRGDAEGVKRYAKKALEFDPENVTAINLLGMAEPDDSPESSRKSLETYGKALELDPEDAAVHNNVGVAHMELKEYAKAEESFRRALFYDPTEKLYRKNLYIALKHRSLPYRLLTAPGDLLMRAVAYISDHYWVLFLIMAVPAGILRASTRSAWARPVVLLLIPLALFVVWFFVFKPLIWIYEYLTFSDIRAGAKEIGARKGGVLGIHGWPFAARFGVFFAILAVVWTALGFAAAHPATRPWVIGAVVTGVVGFILYGWYKTWEEGRREKEASRRRVKFIRAGRTS